MIDWHWIHWFNGTSARPSCGRRLAIIIVSIILIVIRISIVMISSSVVLVNSTIISIMIIHQLARRVVVASPMVTMITIKYNQSC